MEQYLQNIIWMAGLLDGEGCFSIKRTQRKDHRYYQAWVACGMSHKKENEKALKRLKSIFGGSLVSCKNGKVRQSTLSWSVVSNDALKVCKELLPYLVVKKVQAKMIIDFCNSAMNKGIKGKERSKEIKGLQERYFYQMRLLNLKGKLRLQRLNEETPQGEAKV